MAIPEEPPEKPWSKTRRKKELEKVEAALEARLRDETVPALSSPHGLEVMVSGTDPKTILVRYSGVVETMGPYVQPVVRLEFGARNPTEPAENHRVAPDVEPFLSGFAYPQPTVRVLAGVRTFWEKATLLHKLAHMPPERLEQKAAERMSRHYYDVARLADHSIGKQALPPQGWSSWPGWWRTAAILPRELGPVRAGRAGVPEVVAPAKKLAATLAADYEQMREMFFEEPPEWSWILARLGDLESRINRG